MAQEADDEAHGGVPYRYTVLYHRDREALQTGPKCALIGFRPPRRYELRNSSSRRNDADLLKSLPFGIAVWLIVEALFSARFGVWSNVGVDAAVLLLFSFPLIRMLRSSIKEES